MSSPTDLTTLIPDDDAAPPRKRSGRRRSVGLTKGTSFGFSAITVLALGGMFALFLWQSLPVWREVGFGYVTGDTWYFRRDQYGVLPMLYGTLVVAAVALLLATPVGLGAAVFTAEFLPARVRIVVKLAIELLAGIPSVVYGLLGVLLLRNYVYDALRWLGLDPLSGDTLLTAGVLLAVMVLPTIMTLADDALRSVPSAQRMGARGLGLTRTQAIFSVSIPQARRGLIAAVLLAFGRALGETIAVFLVVGRQDNQLPESLLSLRPLFNAGQTFTSKLGGAETNIAYGTSLHWAAIVGLGLLLLVVVGIVTLAGAWLEAKGEQHG